MLTGIAFYVISLSLDKYGTAVGNLSPLNIVTTHFQAINGNALSDEYLDNITDIKFRYILDNERTDVLDLPSKSAVGCYLSHYNLWKKLLEDETVDEYVIFEDDAVPLIGEHEFGELILELREQNVDVALLGYRENDFSFMKRKNKLERIKGLVHGAEAVYVTKAGARKLLRKAFPVSIQVDGYICLMSKYFGLNAYIPKTKVFYQYIHKSSIQKHKPGELKHLKLNPLIDYIGDIFRPAKKLATRPSSKIQ